MKTTASIFVFIMLISSFPRAPSCCAQQSLNKIILWSGCVNENTVCTKIHLKGLFEENPETVPPTILEGDEVTIGVEVTTAAGVSDSEELENDLQPIEVEFVSSEPIIEKEKVTASRLKELIKDAHLIKRLLNDRNLEALAITLSRQEFKVKVTSLEGHVLVDEIIPLQVAFAEELEVEVKRVDYPGCPVPDYAIYKELGDQISYTVPHEKELFRDKRATHMGTSGYYSGYYVGPCILYYTKERRKIVMRSCYNEYNELHGVSTTWDKNGKKETETEYKNGEYHGAKTEWYENGQMKSEIHYKNGKKDGSSAEWFEDGHKCYELQYTNGKKDGLCSYWGESKPGGDKRVGFRGMKLYDEFYRSGELQKVIRYSVHDGTKAEERPYKNGKEHGLEIHYRPNGGVGFTVPYVNGKQHGIAISYDTKGRPCTRTYYENGKGIRSEFLGDCTQ